MAVCDFAVSFCTSGPAAFMQILAFRVSERSRKLASPGLPSDPVTPVLQPAGGDAVQVQQVRRVAPAMPAGGMAAMQATVGHDRLGRHDVAGAQRRAELVEHPGDIGHR
jgi:hypothetical protein